MNFKLEYKKLFGTWLAPSPAAGVTIDLAQHGDAVVFTAWVEVPGPPGRLGTAPSFARWGWGRDGARLVCGVLLCRSKWRLV